jgi:glycosyltransferase involved in cell wall biosynthesis
MAMDKLSVVVPVFNGEKNIAQCINSLRKQTFRSIEIIIVDDGSNDGTNDICRKIAELDDRVVLFRQENQGVSGARNKGIQLATGNHIMFIDGDDVVDSNYVKSFMNRVELEYQGIILLAGIDVFQEGMLVSHEGEHLAPGTILPTDSIVDIWKAHLWNSPVNKIYNTNVLRKHNISFDPNVKIGEDWLFNNAYARCVGVKGFYLLKNIVYKYFMDSDPWRHCSKEDFYLINKRQCEDFRNTLVKLNVSATEIEKFDRSDLDFTISEIRYLARGENQEGIRVRLSKARELARDERVYSRIKKYREYYSFVDIAEFWFHNMFFIFAWEGIRKYVGEVRRGNG